MVHKLSAAEAHFITLEAFAVFKRNSDLRFGQALYNTLHEHYPTLANSLCGTKDDFFYEIKSDVAYEKFYANCVIKEDK